MPDKEVEDAPREDDALSRYTLQLAQYTKWLMLATVVSMLCTGWIAWSTKELRDFAEQQAKDMNASLETTRDAVLAANRQAIASEKANDLGRETSHGQLRAYVSIVDISAEDPLKKEMTSAISFKNVGQTPAIDLRSYSDAEMIAPSAPVRPPRPNSTLDQDGSPASVLGGGLESSDKIIRDTPFKDQDIRDFQAGKKIYIVWAIIHYADVFGEKHQTSVCKYYLNGQLDRWLLCDTDNASN